MSEPGGTSPPPAEDLLRASVEEILALDLDQVRGILVSWLAREVRRSGHESMVVGLSGGIDSALAAALAAEALGPASVLAACLPHRRSSPQSGEHAALVADGLGIPLETIDITAMADGYLDGLERGADRTRVGNVLARCRMTVLYDISARDRLLVLGTSNKSEILLGYTTLWGDGAYALNPLGDLYKTQVRALARRMGLPDEILAKPPTADLWEGQTDETELGFSYETADRVLFLAVDARYRRRDLVAAGFEEALLDAILERVRRNQFKRRLPPWPKVSPRTVPIDFRYLRDWGT